MATSPQRPHFRADTPYIDSCLNLSTTATFFCPQGVRCGGFQLYLPLKYFSPYGNFAGGNDGETWAQAINSTI